MREHQRSHVVGAQSGAEEFPEWRVDHGSAVELDLQPQPGQKLIRRLGQLQAERRDAARASRFRDRQPALAGISTTRWLCVAVGAAGLGSTAPAARRVASTSSAGSEGENVVTPSAVENWR